MVSRFKVVFEGKLKSDIPASEIRERLLKLYRGNQQIVNHFFAGKRLIVRKDLDQSAALKTQAILEKAGVHCNVVQEVSEQQKEVSEPSKPSPDRRISVPVETRYQESRIEESPIQDKNRKASYDFSFRGIIAEAWGLTAGIKGKIIGSLLLAGMLSAALIFLGYGIARLLGEPGRNLYVVYGLQYGFSLLAYPLLAGLVMMGVKQAMGEQVDFSMVFHFFTGRILLLSVILALVNFAMFAFLLSMGVDHFYAQGSNLLTLPFFALTVPLVAGAGLHPFTAIGRCFMMLRGHFLIIAGMYLALVCINLFGNFVIIGFVWTVPLLFVANGVLFRNLINAEMRKGAVTGISYDKFRTASFQDIPRRVSQPVLEGNAWQNILAAVFVGLIFVSAGARLWALNEAYKIYLPDHVASNSRGICIHSDKKLYFLSPEGRTERRVELSALGLNREPADLELLEDGSLLIGDMDKKTILRCSTENLSCRTVGPANNYRIADNFKFLADEKRNLLFIADTNNHRIVVQDLEGAYYRTVEGSARIDYPNDMTLDEQGMLWVSNTLHERLLCFKIDGDSVTETGRYITLNPLESGVSAVGQALLGAKDKKQTLEDLLAAQKKT